MTDAVDPELAGSPSQTARQASADQAELRDEPTLEEFYDSAPLAYLSLRQDATVLRTNQTFLDWTGYSPDDLEGRRFPSLLTIGGQVYYETHCLPLLLAGGVMREVALDLRRADGTVQPVLVGAKVHRRDADDRPLVIRLVLFDASHRRLYERELQSANERERGGRERAEASGRLAAKLATATSTKQVIERVTAELLAVPHVTLARLLPPAPAASGTRPMYMPLLDGDGVTAVFPLISSRGRHLGSLRTILDLQPSPDQSAFLHGAADLTARALERLEMQRAEKLAGPSQLASDLPNARWWAHALGTEIRSAGKTMRPLTLALVELEQFDRYVQRHGHVAGDSLLLALSDAWRRSGHDLLSRAGGEEFAALLPGVDLRHAEEIAADVRRNAIGPFAAGIVQWNRTEDAAGLLRRAEQALQAAKTAGL